MTNLTNSRHQNIRVPLPIAASLISADPNKSMTILMTFIVNKFENFLIYKFY